MSQTQLRISDLARNWAICQHILAPTEAPNSISSLRWYDSQDEMHTDCACMAVP